MDNKHLAIWKLNRNPLTLCVKFYEKERIIEQSMEKNGKQITS